MKYNYFGVEDFIKDEYFQKWILSTDEMTDNFWENWLLKHPNKKDDVAEAKRFILLMNFNPDEFSDTDFNTTWQNIIEKRDYVNKKSSPKFYILKVAALLVLFLNLGYFLLNQKTTKKAHAKIIIPNKSITLKLENGTTKVIKENINTSLENSKGKVFGNQKGNELIYKKEIEKEKIAYNTLTVPYGKRFKVKLSDGTIVHLNSGTSLKYPVNFIKGQDRLVFLENGEAYFEVAKDKEHPFVVNSNQMNIRVLGTKFNVSSYPEDSSISTVLVEGSVKIYDANKTYNPKTAFLLKPNFKALWKKKTKKIEITNADVDLYTAWIYGKIIFRYITFQDMLKKLERHYNVEIIDNNKTLDNKLFAASFDIETIEDVLETLNTNYHINYTIKDNKIIIN
ncbi:FecR family protein [Polaribacter cellanae]|uniref:FecR family protein n=1 Tax=Polaribacter cellanae TaxID=2818493 RepID=A0A975CMB9_9FLAO|nr:FecR family protein [Polaribacter cellanae]QTE22566.1 FecR family protein [Polaribacter cellanae]